MAAGMAAGAIGLNVVEATQINRLPAVGRNLRIVGPFQLEHIFSGEEPRLVLSLGLSLSRACKARQKAGQSHPYRHLSPHT